MILYFSELLWLCKGLPPRILELFWTSEDDGSWTSSRVRKSLCIARWYPAFIPRVFKKIILARKLSLVSRAERIDGMRLVAVVYLRTSAI
jgi:hypothetical protein